MAKIEVEIFMSDNDELVTIISGIVNKAVSGELCKRGFHTFVEREFIIDESISPFGGEDNLETRTVCDCCGVLKEDAVTVDRVK